MACPFLGEHEDGFDFDDNRDKRKPPLRIIIPERSEQGQTPTKAAVIAAAEAVVAGVADRVPIEARKSLKEVLTESGATAATGLAAAWAIRQVFESKGFAGGGYFFNAMLFADPQRRRSLGAGGASFPQSPGGGFF